MENVQSLIEQISELQIENAHLENRLNKLDDVVTSLNKDVVRLWQMNDFLKNKLEEMSPRDQLIADIAPNGWNR
jgi:hypothetical protein